LGSKIGTFSGAHFMLTGDAASLIDPVSGDGIGNAMISGKLAAEQAIRCYKQKDFSAGFMKQYDAALLSSIGAELKMHHRLQRMLSKTPLLLDAIFLAGRNKALKRMIQKSM
jgi:flavin-dependent dehydrogenase